MNALEQAVIDAAKAWREPQSNAAYRTLQSALDALLESEKPQAVVFPDPPSDHVGFQRSDGHTWRSNYFPISAGYDNDKDPNVRRLRVTYTPMDEPSPAERIAELEKADQELSAQNERGFAMYMRAANRIAELEAERSEWLGDMGRIVKLKDSNSRLFESLQQRDTRIAELEADRDRWRQTATDRYFLSDPIHPDRFRTADGLKFVSMPQPDDDSDLLWGVQYARGFVHSSTNEDDATREVTDAPQHRRVVRLRVIEVEAP